MNEREKKLVILMGAMAFIIVNLFLYFRIYVPRRADAQVKIRQYEATLANADTFMRMRDEVADEIEWLENNHAKVAPVQDVSAELQRFAQTEATRNGLTIKRQRILPSVENPAATFHRARVEVELSGREDALYRWIDRLQTPTEFRAVTSIRLSPEREDDTLIECKLVVEEWFTPEPEEV
jgi:type II secretory pathway component PulM